MTPRSPEQSQSPAPGAATPVVIGSLVVTFALIALVTLLPSARDARLWGLNHLAFYSLPVRLAALALMALAFVPAVARVAFGALTKFPDALAGGGSRSTMIIFIVSIASVVLFYQFRSATLLLGDGQLLAKSFEASYQGHATVIMRSARAILANDSISPGMTLLYYWTVKVAVVVFKQTPAEGMRWLPCMLGGVFIFFFLRLVRDAPLSNALKVWLLVLGLFTTSVQLFFGYVENYSAILILLAMYVSACFLVIHRRSALWVPIVLLAVSVFTHIQSILFAPSLIFLMAWQLAKGRRRVVLRSGVPVLMVLTGAAAIIARAGNIPGDFYLPLTADNESYGIISPGHLGDLLNEAMMLLPIALVALAVWWAGRKAAHQPTNVTSGNEWFAMPVEWQYVALMVVPCLMYMTLFKPEIGMARDWDLFTMTSVALVPLVLLIVNRYSKAAQLSGAAMARVSAPALVMAAVMGIGWFGVNASGDRTGNRFEAILAYDQTHVGYAYENLALYYQSRGQLAKAIDALETGAHTSGNPRLYARLAVLYEENGDIDAGITMLRDILATHPDHSKARSKLMDLLEKAKRYDELITVSRDGVKYHPKNAIYYFALGESLIRTGQTDEGLDVFRTCLTLGPPDGAREHVLRRFEQFGQTPP